MKAKVPWKLPIYQLENDIKSQNTFPLRFFALDVLQSNLNVALQLLILFPRVADTDDVLDIQWFTCTP